MATKNTRTLNYILFLGIMLAVFGIRRLNLDDLSFAANERSYYMFAGAAVSFVVFALLATRNRRVNN